MVELPKLDLSIPFYLFDRPHVTTSRRTTARHKGAHGDGRATHCLAAHEYDYSPLSQLSARSHRTFATDPHAPPKPGNPRKSNIDAYSEGVMKEAGKQTVEYGVENHDELGNKAEETYEDTKLKVQVRKMYDVPKSKG